MSDITGTPVSTEALQAAGLIPSTATSNTDPIAVAAAIASPASPITRGPAPIPVTVPIVSVKAPNTTFSRYAAVLFTALITIGSATQILPAHHDAQSLVQFGIILAGVIGAALSSVTTGPWPGIFKTGSATIAAILTLLVPYLANGASFSSFTYTTWITFGVAAASALATELGVNIRTVANAKVEENLLK